MPPGTDKAWPYGLNYDGTIAVGYANSIPTIWIKEGDWSAHFWEEYLQNLGADFRGLDLLFPIVSADGKSFVMMYGPYSVSPEGHADTTPWLGLLWVEKDPWVWLVNPGQWLFGPGEQVTEDGAWMHVPNPVALLIVPIDGTDWGLQLYLAQVALPHRQRLGVPNVTDK